MKVSGVAVLTNGGSSSVFGSPTETVVRGARVSENTRNAALWAEAPLPTKSVAET